MKTRNVLAMISPMSSERVRGIARYAKEHGWNLMLQDRLGHTPLAWNGDGILATLRPDPATFLQIEKLMRRGIPLVDLTVSRPDVDVPRVVSDHAEIGRLAAEHFAEREFRHVAWFSSGWGNVHHLRYEGFAAAWGGAVPRWVVRSRHRVTDWPKFVNWIGSLLADTPRPLAVLTYDEADAARLLYAAHELGVTVPEELAILSIGNNPLICENQSVPLSSVDQNLEAGGYQAAALLDRLMNGPAPHGGRHPVELIPPRGIVTRRSTDVIAVGDALVRAALLHVAGHLAEPVGAPQVAEALGVRRAELDRRFRSVLNRSVGEEVRRQRLLRAKRLLEESRLSIAEIAAQTGYCTPSHLTNAFKGAYGLSPKTCRAKALQDPARG